MLGLKLDSNYKGVNIWWDNMRRLKGQQIKLHYSMRALLDPIEGNAGNLLAEQRLVY